MPPWFTFRNGIGAAAAVVAATGVAAVYGRASAGADGALPTASADRPVLVAVAHLAPEQTTRSFVATIRPRIETDMSFRVSGKIARRMVDVGQSVVAGDILAKLDETDLRLQKEQAEAELAASRVALEQTAADESRGADLRAKGWNAQATYDRQRSAVEEARGRNRRAQRAVELAANALAYAVLRADSDGVVTTVNVEPGQVVAAGQAAIRIARKGETEASVALPEAFLARAREGKATLVLWSDPGKTYAATLRELSPIADTATRTFAARFSLPQADTKVSLGMSATLTVSAQSAEKVARVPMSALFDEGRGSTLWTVAADGALAQKSVDVLRYENADVVVSSGLQDGDRVVVLGVQKLDAGQKVRTISRLSF